MADQSLQQDSAPGKCAYVYVMCRADGLTKVGVAEDPEVRKSHLEYEWKMGFSIVALPVYEPSGISYAVEKLSKGMLYHFWKFGEFYDIDPDQAAHVVKFVRDSLIRVLMQRDTFKINDALDNSHPMTAANTIIEIYRGVDRTSLIVANAFARECEILREGNRYLVDMHMSFRKEIEILKRQVAALTGADTPRYGPAAPLTRRLGT